MPRRPRWLADQRPTAVTASYRRVPCRSIGRPQAGFASEFADFSDEDSNFSEDFLPEDGRLPFSR